MGNKEIARFLLEGGARMNVFCAAMLGELEIVKDLLALHPDLNFSKGPHGLQLLHHAKKGGPEALPVLEFLESIGAPRRPGRLSPREFPITLPLPKA